MQITQNEIISFANAVATGVSANIYGYPLYNYLTQHQNHLRSAIAEKSNNPILKFGCKYFSQNDEDGILLEILKRTNHLNSNHDFSFIEFGVEWIRVQLTYSFNEQVERRLGWQRRFSFRRKYIKESLLSERMGYA